MIVVSVKSWNGRLYKAVFRCHDVGSSSWCLLQVLCFEGSVDFVERELGFCGEALIPNDNFKGMKDFA